MKMKRMILTLICLVALISVFSCQEKTGLDVDMNESIVLDLSSVITKAEDTAVESFVSHIDAMIFSVGADSRPAEMLVHERLDVNNASEITMQARRSSFESGMRYYVYLVANSTLDESVFAGMSSFNDLIDRKQEDMNVHLTGLTIDNAPKHFLMDAEAVGADGNSPVVLNDGNPVSNTVLDAVLCRAAAKVSVNITASEEIDFRSFGVDEGSEGGLYYIRNLPYDTFLLAQAKDASDITASVRTTAKSNNVYFSWNPLTYPKNVSLVAYVYPNHWADDSVLEHETCIVMNLPITFTQLDEHGNPVLDGEGNAISSDYVNNWYKIPMTADKKFERNNYYEVNITLSRPGAISESTPVEIEEIYYTVEEWDEHEISIGGDDKPVYLMVNRTEMEMHNIPVDYTTLEFASSSPVTVTVKDVYYYNKFGQKITLSEDISGTTDGGIAGNITVSSPVPGNNAIRYFTLVVTNQDGLTREVSVIQYPLEYITNQQAYYSYRTDFMQASSTATHYQNKGDRIVSASWDGNSWDLDTRTGSSFFFTSKVADQNTDGTSDIYFYSFSNYSNNPLVGNNTVSGLDNARMYHVQITATSGTYTLGIPRMDSEGFTESGSDNAALVSPSFMIASQLGAVYSSGGDTSSNRERAKTHCKEYAETYRDENGNVVHLTDWRLPTAAEIGIIVKFQTSSEVMDTVLGGANYFCASGTVATNIQGNNEGYFLRCIRDVY